MEPPSAIARHARHPAARRIGAARARWERWSQRPSAIGLLGTDLEPLADAIEAADDALWALECPGHTQTAAQKALKVALADLWRVEGELRRAIAAFAAATEDPTIRHRAGLPAPRVHPAGTPPLVAAIARATLRPMGCIELTIECPGLGVAPGVHVQVRRREGPEGRYRPLGTTWEPIFLDQTAHQCAPEAAYKVVPCRDLSHGRMSPRVVVPIPESAAPTRNQKRRAARARAVARALGLGEPGWGPEPF